MTRSAEIAIDFGDGRHQFALKWGQLMELQEKRDAGAFFLHAGLHNGTWKVQDLSEVIRLGLIGGGMPPSEALTLVRRYVEERPPMESLLTAQAVLGTALAGAPDEQPGKPDAGRQGRTSRSRAEKSGSPKSSEQEPPSG